MKKDTIVTFFALFSSFSTIFCCALPIIFVMLGMGASFASMTSALPIINSLLEYTTELFILTAIFLFTSGYMIFFRPQTCPIEPKLAKLCAKMKKINKVIWFISLILFLCGIFFKYLLIYFV